MVPVMCALTLVAMPRILPKDHGTSRVNSHPDHRPGDEPAVAFANVAWQRYVSRNSHGGTERELRPLLPQGADVPRRGSHQAGRGRASPEGTSGAAGAHGSGAPGA